MISGAPKYGNIYGYNGELYNVSTEYLYLRARYYDTGMGQFTSEDSYLDDITAPATLNRYAYGVGNPMNYTDPSGHAAENESYGGGMTPLQRSKLNQQKQQSKYVATQGANVAKDAARRTSQLNYKNRTKQTDYQYVTSQKNAATKTSKIRKKI